MEPTPPAAVADVLGDHRWDRLEATSPSGSVVWRVGPHHVKHLPAGEPGPGVGAEAARLRWLGPHLPAPEVVVVSDDDGGGGWLVTATLPGRPAHRADHHPDAEVLVRAVGDALRRLHALPAAVCPFDAGWHRLDEEVAANLAAGRIDTSAFDQPFCRYGAERLVELWRQGRPTDDVPVVVHGDATLPNVLVDGSQLTGFVDVGRLGVGDRHLDLAVAHRSIHRNLGPAAVFAFYDAYGTDPDLARLEHHLLGDLLRRGRSPDPER